MNIYNLLDPSTILANIEVKDKNDLLDRLVNLLSNAVDDSQLEDIRDAVFDREAIMSTGVGKGLAIPHGKAKSIDKNLAGFALLKTPVDFDSIDDEPVKMVFLLVGPNKKNNLHIKLLSRISRLMNSSEFRNRLTECESAEEIHETFKKEEEKYFSN